MITTVCLICKVDISQPLQQFGDTKIPMCQSCYLDGNDWIYEIPIITDALQHGSSIEEAYEIELGERNKEFTATIKGENPPARLIEVDNEQN